MNAFIVLVCSVLAVVNGQYSSVLMIGSKYIRPRQPYFVALANPLRADVKMNITLSCDDGIATELTKTLRRLSVLRFSLKVPNGVSTDSDCRIVAENNGGDKIVYHEAYVSVASKTLSIFIITDKPIYKPGEIVKFRVVVLDMATRPIDRIDNIHIDLKDSNQTSRIQWKRAVLYKGTFATGYLLPSTPELGMWNIIVTVNDGIICNEKHHEFEVREYEIPKFVINITPFRNIISDQEIGLRVNAHYTFGSPVQGNIIVKLSCDNNVNLPKTLYTSRSFTGSDEFKFNLEEELTIPEDEDYVMVKVNVSLTEEFSNFVSNVTKEIPVFKYPYKIAYVGTPKDYHPGSFYHCKFSVEDHYGVPVQNKFITVTTDTGVQESAKLDEYGIASLALPMPNTADTVSISVVFEDEEYENIHSIESSGDASSQYLQIFRNQGNAKESTASFTVRSNGKFSNLYYFVASRGNILLGNYVQFSMKTQYTFELKLTVDMTVQSQLLVFSLNSSHVMSDSFNLEYIANKFAISLDVYTITPNVNVEIEVTAEKDSYIALQAIDQGALQLGHGGFGITKTHILEDLDGYTPAHSSLSNDQIDDLGLFLRAGFYKQDEPSRAKRSTHHKKHQAAYKPILLRTDFSESWIWENHTMNQQNKLTIYKVTPHTITSWLVSGFALSPTRGLGLIRAPANLTVFKPFYMMANLPYSIKRDEVVRIQVTLFNFMMNTITVDVTLYNKRDDIEFMDQKSDDKKYRRKAIFAESYKTTSVSFLIQAKRIGEIPIKIEAASQLRTDGLQHILRVTPESRSYNDSQARFINLPSYNTQSEYFHLNIPKQVDEGTVKVSVIIDPLLFGTIAQNLNSLFAIPTDAGSLNLLTFIPNVAVLDYIKQTNKKEPIIEQKAVDYLSTGYTNQMRYRHSSGAFGQWDPPKNEPSVFLTALVANSFSTADKHIEIDQTVITKAFSWIERKQKEDGCFEEDGEIIFEPMQGKSSTYALTAFVVAAIKENNSTAILFKELTEKATKCLVDNFDSLTETYDIALATYALSLMGHHNKKYFNKLIENRINENGEVYWNNEEISVEIAGYAILSYIARNMYYDAIPIMKWLNKQRYYTGAFPGVHSTFVGLKALVKMAVYLNRNQNDYTVDIRYSMINRTNRHHQSFGVLNSDDMKAISHELHGNTRQVFIEIDGQGFGMIQVAYQYFMNIQADHEHTSLFNLDVNVLDVSTFETQYLRVCLSYKMKNSKENSGVTLVEVFLPSGFLVHENAVKDRRYQIQRTERAFHNTAMYVYYNSVSKTEVCFDVIAYRKYKIALHRPSYVAVYDTEDMSKYALKSYEGKVLQPCQICDREDCRSMNC